MRVCRTTHMCCGGSRSSCRAGIEAHPVATWPRSRVLVHSAANRVESGTNTILRMFESRQDAFEDHESRNRQALYRSLPLTDVLPLSVSLHSRSWTQVGYRSFHRQSGPRQPNVQLAASWNKHVCTATRAPCCMALCCEFLAHTFDIGSKERCKRSPNSY